MRDVAVRNRLRRRRARHALAVAIAPSICAGFQTEAKAEVPFPNGSESAGSPSPPRPAATELARPQVIVGAGAVFQVLQYQEAYRNTGPTVEAGIETPMFGSRSHHLRLVGEWMVFPAAATQLWIGSIDAAWRWFPAARLGFHVGLGMGGALVYEHIDLSLAARRIDDSQVRFGIPFCAVAGWTLGDRFDVDIAWKQIAFAAGVPATIGHALVTVGWRLL